jgi:hypothetical protein
VARTLTLAVARTLTLAAARPLMRLVTNNMRRRRSQEFVQRAA